MAEGATTTRPRIAILGWGSLIWNAGELRLGSAWSAGGPTLPIEFSRVSRDGRLTLVIDVSNGAPVVTRYGLGDYDELEHAIEALKDREQTRATNIGFVDVGRGLVRSRDAGVAQAVRRWAQAVKVDAVLWTDLAPNFQEMRRESFSSASATKYVLSLDGEASLRALEYVASAPAEVDTPTRQMIRDALARSH